MAWPIVNDLDYLATRLHGRRSRMAEGERLEELCRLPTLAEFAQAVYPQAAFESRADFQRRLVTDLVQELSGYLKHLEGPGADLLAWMLCRFQIEEIKMLLRGILSRTPLEAYQEQLVPLPAGLGVDVPALAAAESLETFVERLPLGLPRKCLREAMSVYRDRASPFLFEGALDRGYFLELLARAERIRGADQELIQPMLLQEVDAFHLMLVTRGRFQYDLETGLLSGLRIQGSRIFGERFTALLAADDLGALAALAVGRAIDVVPAARPTGEGSAAVDAQVIEALTRKRLLRLADRAFRRSQLGLGVVLGYVELRRVEVANLITASEAIVDGLAAEDLRGRFIARTDLEAAYV